jgi:hypothetical protein
MAQVGNLQANLVAQTASFRTDLEKARQQLGGFERRSNQALSKMDRAWRDFRRSAGQSVKSMFSLRNAAISLAGAGGIGLVVKNSLDAAANLGDLASRAGVTTDALQTLTFAAQQYGVEQDTLVDGLRELQVRASEFASDGGGPASDTFERLGISAQEARRLMDQADNGFQTIIQRIRELDSQAAQARAFDELFGGEAGERLRQITGDIGQLTERARQLGLVIDQSMIQQADEARDSMRTLGQVMQKQLISATARLAPQLSSLFNELLQALPDVVTWTERWAKAFGVIDSLSARSELAKVTEDLDRAQERLKGLRKAPEDGGVLFSFLEGTSISDQQEAIEKQFRKVRELQLRAALLREEINRPTVDLGGGSVSGAGDTGGGSPDSSGSGGDGGNTINVPTPPTGVTEQRDRLSRQAQDLRNSLNPAWSSYTERVREARNLLELNKISQREFMQISQQAAEQLNQSTAQNTDGLQRMQRAADQLGFTFSSAFEDAIIEGKNLRSVMQGLLQDIARIALRKSVTEPAGNFFADVISGGFSLFSGGTSTGGAAVPSSQGGLGQPLPTFAEGGIADRPSIFGEGAMPEAAVPLPNGREIPVNLQGGSGTVVNIGPINVQGAGGTDEERRRTGEIVGREVERAINRKVDARIRQATRPGGQLNRSADPI